MHLPPSLPVAIKANEVIDEAIEVIEEIERLKRSERILICATETEWRRNGDGLEYGVRSK
jgi:hypothetical protein